MSEINNNDVCISHQGMLQFDSTLVEQIVTRLEDQAPNLALPLEEELKILEDLTTSEFGRNLIKNKGLDSYGIDYAISGDHSKVMSGSIEKWILSEAPIFLATKDRFTIFQEQINQYMSDNSVIASIPSGGMGAFLNLDYSNKSNIKLIGIDIDQNALSLAQKNLAVIHSQGEIVSELKQANAWGIKDSFTNDFDIIVSNGLNIYEPSLDRLIELYRNFFATLNFGGYLITSYIAKSPEIDPESTWRDVNQENLVKQKAVFGDIIQVKWQNSWSKNEMVFQLESAGFKVLEVKLDRQGMFPTVIARK